MVGEFFTLPEAPFFAFSAGDNQCPNRAWINESDDVLVLRSAKVWSEPTYEFGSSFGRFFFVGFERDRDKPPRVIVKSAIIIPFMEFVEADCVAKPYDPTL